MRTAAAARREEEAKLVKAGQPVPFPGWDKLRKEENEEKPALILIVTDEAGQVVRRITAPAAKGLHRVAWNLRYPGVEPTQLESAGREAWERGPEGPMVVPGTFHRHLGQSRGWRHDDARRASGFRRRIARPGQPAGEGQGRPPEFQRRRGSCSGR